MIIITYNVNASVCYPLQHNSARERLARIPAAVRVNRELASADVMLLQELVVGFDSFCNDMRHMFPYSTSQVSGCMIGDNIKFWTSGLCILSKHPIAYETHHVFDNVGYGYERAMAKAVQYARIEFGGGCVHVFNTHLCAWTGQRARTARKKQVKQVIKFIKDLGIPSDEMVVLGGDLNIGHGEHVDWFNGELDLCPSPASEPLYSYDPTTNTTVCLDDPNEYKGFDLAMFVKRGQTRLCEPKLLDYFLTRHGLPPVNCNVRVVQLKAIHPFVAWVTSHARRRVDDLSDHYPVIMDIKVREGLPGARPRHVRQHQQHYHHHQHRVKTEEWWWWVVVWALLTLVVWSVLVAVIVPKVRPRSGR